MSFFILQHLMFYSPCSKCLLLKNVWKSIYPGTTLDYQGQYTNKIRDLSTPLTLSTILLAIKINRKLVTIDPKFKRTILKTGNDYSLAKNSTEFLY